jgi:hypothetical protein
VECHFSYGCISTRHLSVESFAFFTSVSHKVLCITSCEPRLALFCMHARCTQAVTSNCTVQHRSLLINYQAQTHTWESLWHSNCTEQLKTASWELYKTVTTRKHETVFQLGAICCASPADRKGAYSVLMAIFIETYKAQSNFVLYLITRGTR